MTAVRATVPFTAFEQIKAAREIIQHEAEALQSLSQSIPVEFAQAVQLISQCRGSIIVTGIGKAGWIAQKISATLASTGNRSHYLHPSEAMHGDLGRIGSDDLMLILSNSGETAEVLQLLPALEKLQVPIVAVVGKNRCSLARASTVALAYGETPEACPLGLAPSTSTAIMLALGDALALVASRSKGFQATDFARLHPGGNLGQRLSRVDDVMRPVADCRVADDEDTVRQIYVRFQGPKRRSGAILLTDEMGVLSGIFTDSDLARLLECGQDAQLDQPVYDVMTHDPITVSSGTKTPLAVEKLALHNISELPVVDGQGRPLGIIDITDVVALLPRT